MQQYQSFPVCLLISQATRNIMVNYVPLQTIVRYIAGIVIRFAFCSGNKFLCLLRGWPLPRAQIQVNLQLDLQRYAVLLLRCD